MTKREKRARAFALGIPAACVLVVSTLFLREQSYARSVRSANGLPFNSTFLDSHTPLSDSKVDFGGEDHRNVIFLVHLPRDEVCKALASDFKGQRMDDIVPYTDPKMSGCFFTRTGTMLFKHKDVIIEVHEEDALSTRIDVLHSIQ